MITLLAFLCGVPVGFILGVVAVWRLTKSLPPEDPDYSGGL